MNDDQKTIAELRNRVAELEARDVKRATDIQEVQAQDRKTQEKLDQLERQIRAMHGNMG
jgi:chromosome segregation ATPase